jgi:methylaspartate mutase epsilon subunit
MAQYTIRNKRLSDEEFFRIRKEEVLPQWETSRDIENLDENIAAAYEYSVGLGRNYAIAVREASERGIHLFQPQFGQGLTEFMLAGMGYVEENSPLVPNGLWNIFSDSYTRKNKYKLAAEGIARSRKEGATMLNGWPIVNHGVEEAGKSKRPYNRPVSQLHRRGRTAGLRNCVGRRMERLQLPFDPGGHGALQAYYAGRGDSHQPVRNPARGYLP